MTLDELIKTIDIHLPGNRFDNQMKTAWISEIEGKLYEEIVSRSTDKNRERGVKLDVDGINENIDSDSYSVQIDPLNQRKCCGCDVQHEVYELPSYKYENDKNRELICPDRFCDVYIHYVLAKMHAADSEIEDYNNEVLLYDASYKDYAAWHIRNFKRSI